VNGPANPATRGQYVFIYATGEGVTIPPGVDGRVTGTPLPTAAAANCAATMGGQPAPTNFCGEAPGFTAGVMQVNALVPESVTSCRTGDDHHRRRHQPGGGYAGSEVAPRPRSALKAVYPRPSAWRYAADVAGHASVHRCLAGCRASRRRPFRTSGRQ